MLRLFIFGWLICPAALQAQHGFHSLQTEHLDSPLGIDAPHPRLSWKLDDTTGGAGPKIRMICVGTDSVAVSRGDGNCWRGIRSLSDDQLAYYYGRTLEPFTKYYWRVEVEGHPFPIVSQVASFETGMMQPGDWKGSWISDSRDIALKPAPYFRRTFTVQKTIVSARAYIAVAGLYELYINGRRIGDHVLDPMYTRFDRRNLYVTYDVTRALKEGSNAIGVLLGNGWYNLQSTAVWYFDKAPWRSRPSFCMDIRVTYSDGSVETISTDKSWKTALSPIVFNSIYTGEHVDARLNIPHWNEASLGDSAWKPVIYRPAPSQNIVAQAMAPIRVVDTVRPISIGRFSDTDYVFDLGQNIAGVSAITLQGPAGTVVHVTHGELLNPSGHVDQSNINVHYRPTDDSDPFQTDVYTLKDGEMETFKPHFNYKGFQYVEVTSTQPITLTKQSLVGYVMHSDAPAVGKVVSSNPIINKIWAATNSSYLANLYGYPTDCPQREKNGWTGDAQINIETGLYNFDAITVYEKWIADLRDEQQPNGVLPSIVPSSGWGYEWGNGPDWTSAIAIIPWNLYLFYGDYKCLIDSYDNIKRYVDHIHSLYPSGICLWGLGDWVPVKSKTPVPFTSTAYYYEDVVIMAQAAKIYGNGLDYAAYTALADSIKAGFNRQYLDTATGNYDQGFQTELSAALFWHLVPTALIPKTAALLAARVRADGIKLDVGLLGTKTILNALSENGYADLAYQLASSTTEPSWGWWIASGATTLYEGWPATGKLDFSLNHIMFGEIGAWLYKGLGGILPDPAKPGFKHILLEPHFVAGLDSFYCTHDGPYGKIVSSWKRVGKTIEYTAVIPVNSTADVRSVEGGKPITKSLTAGRYTFKIEY